MAPVYKNQSVKEWSLYLPKGKWTDFFTGKQYDGGRLLNGYDVSDYKIPVFVREGGIIPMYPESYYDRDRTQQKPRNPLTLDIYPSDKKITRFELIEDDGLTYQFKTDSMYNKTLIESHPNLASDKVIIKINGNYEGRGYVGMPETRDYLLQIHGGKPQSVSLKNKKVLNKKIDDWYFDVEKNILHIKIEKQESINAFSIQVFY